MRYILFSREQCPYCTAAIDLLEENNLRYDVVDFKINQGDVLDAIKVAVQWPTVPMVFSREGNDIKLIGGYTDLKKSLEEDE